MVLLFKCLVWAHVVSGTIGLISLWVPILARKGSRPHVNWGRVFLVSMIATGSLAVLISICSLIAPLETHPFSDDAVMVRGLFGWMMMYLGVLTVALAWHCFITVRHKRNHEAQRTVLSLVPQLAMGLGAVNCAAYGIVIGQPIMVGVAVPGIAAAILNSHYLLLERQIHQEWLVQHFRAGIGAGISVYTAFFAFGAVNTVPALAFNPILWALPTVLGVAYMIHQQLQVFRQRVRLGLGHEMPVGRLLLTREGRSETHRRSRA